MKINDEGTSNAAHWYERAMKAESRLAEAEADVKAADDLRRRWEGRAYAAEALLREARDTLCSRCTSTDDYGMSVIARIDAHLGRDA